ncbi:translation machinery-associated protein 16 [Xylogone sp. PMI_703]|nr:translation machinery-associated protein 16 [Xylogone sp. PMI_703]
MPTSVDKARKKISKKKGDITVLHENSRDSQRLRRAQMRDEKLQKISASRRKMDQPYIERATYFQDAIRKNNSQPLEFDAIKALIESYVHQHGEEFEGLKKARRAGRPASTREDLLKMKITALKKEYENGFYVPDITDADNVTFLDRWEGTWSYLSTLKWVRITKQGVVQPCKFPPKGQS